MVNTPDRRGTRFRRAKVNHGRSGGEPPHANIDAVPCSGGFAYDDVMAVFADQAVVLLRYEYSETSQVLVLMTREHGKVRAIAKGIRRGTKTRFAAGIDLLDIGRVVITSRHERSAKLATVTEWRQTRSLPGLREKLFRIYAAQYTSEITGHLTEDWDPHVDLFDHFVATLVELSDASDPLPPLVAFQLGLLSEIGSLPRFEACVVCGRSGDLTYFTSLEGGMICRHCEAARVEKREVSETTLGVVRWLLNERPGSRTDCGPTSSKPATVPADSTERLSTDLSGPFSLLDYHMAHLMGRESRLAPRLVSRQQRRST